MDTDPSTHVTPPKRSIWQKLGAGSLSISVIFHVVLLLIGLIWVLKIIPPPAKKDVEFMAKSGGGGSPSSESQAKKHQVQMMQPTLSRVSAMDAVSNFVLPDPEDSSQMASLGSLSSGGLSKGLGGEGSGGGKGNGNGTGFGNGMAPGMSDGKGSKSPFGMTSVSVNALTGTFYDFKQSRTGEPLDNSVDDVVKIINDFTNRGWRESSFNKYFKAKQTLYQTKLYIPAMSANGAPAAFNCADQVKPSRWAVVYQGVVTPPHTGKFRFVGSGDDILTVRFNNRNVFDHGFYSGTTQVKINANWRNMKEGKENGDVKKMLRREYPMEQPLKTYTYNNTKDYNNTVGGLGVGPVFEAEAGKNYPIDILLSELPGGLFGGVLLIEEVGVNYEKESGGSPILPLFRLDNSVPPPAKGDNAPPYDAKGPVWKVVAEKGKSEI